MAARSKVKNPVTLADFLQNQTVTNLKDLALLISSNLPTRKADLIERLLDQLDDPLPLEKIWRILDKLQRATVAEATYSESGMYDSLAFKAKYNVEADWGNNSPFRHKKSLTRLRLFFYGYPLRIPSDMREVLRTFVPKPTAAKLQGASKLPTSYQLQRDIFDNELRQYHTHEETHEYDQRKTEHDALHDIKAVLRLIDSGKVRVSAKTQRPTAASVKAVAAMLAGGDFYDPATPLEDWEESKGIGAIKAFAWPLLMQSAGFTKVDGTKLILSPAGRKALNDAPEKAIRTAWKKWLKSKLLDEFNRIHTIKGQTGKGKRTMTALSGRRTTIVNALKASKPNQWMAFKAFSLFMRANGYRFQVNRELWNLYIEESGYGALGYDGFGTWEIVQDRYILVFLFEFAATLGLIDVHYRLPRDAKPDFGNVWGTDDYALLSRYDGLTYFRINGLGAYCLGMTAKFVPSPVEKIALLRVLPNLDIVAIAPLMPADKLMIERVAEQSAENVYQLQQKKLLQAVEHGIDIKQIEEFLAAKSENALPQTVTVLLQESAERATQLSYRGTAHLIEAADQALALLIVNHKKLRSFCMLAGEQHIVVPDDKMNVFRKVVLELGYALKQ